MKKDLSTLISELVTYALKAKLIEDSDTAYATNSVMITLGVSDYTGVEISEPRPL